MPNWEVRVRYETQQDLVVVRWQRLDLLTNGGKSGERSYGPTDLEDALAHVQRLVRTLGAPRFF